MIFVDDIMSFQILKATIEVSSPVNKSLELMCFVSRVECKK